MVITTYNEIKVRGEKSGKCVCGKRRVRTKTFSQTVNPFNKNKDGNIKTVEEIDKELYAERAEWMKLPVTCKKPDYWEMSESQRELYDKNGQVYILATCGSLVLKTKKD